MDPMDDWLIRVAANRLINHTSRTMLTTNETTSDSHASNNRRISLLTRTSSTISSSDCLEMLTNTETSSISTNGSNEETSPEPETSKHSERIKRMRKKVNELWADLIECLSETNEQIAVQQPKETEKLNPTQLRRDIFRCLNELHVYLELLGGIREFFIWRNPLSSLCALCVIFYCIFQEWEITVFLGLILVQLGINYLETQKKINIGIRFLPRREIPLPRLDLSGLQLIFEAARQVQMLITLCADCLEKLRALFMWKKPEVTFRFVLFISCFFLISLFSVNTYIIVVGLLCVNKMFVMTRLYYRFPRTRYMFDIAFYFYRSTPIESKKPAIVQKTHPPVSKKRTSPLVVNSPVRRDTDPSILTERPNSRSNSMSGLSFDSSQRNSLNFAIAPHGDASVENSDVWVSEEQDENTDAVIRITRSCEMNDNFSLRKTQGFITLTERQLEFRSKSTKNTPPTVLEMPFETILTIEKAKKSNPLNRLKFGSNKGIQIELCNKRQIQFLGIARFDEFFDSLVQMVQLSDVDTQQD